MSYAANDGSDPAVLEPAVALQLSLGEEAGEGNCAFFYGTLMHPAILRRVIANDGSHLEICSAILFLHVRLHVEDCDYPAVVPCDVGQKVMGAKILSEEDEAVRGVVVRGLTAQDIALLNVFEGHEYRRESISAVAISAWSPLNDAKTGEVLSESSALPDATSAPKISAFVYIWGSSTEYLEPQIWSYDVFVKEKIGNWLDRDPTEEEQQEDKVSRRLSMAGTIVAPVGGEGVMKTAEKHSHETSDHPIKPTFGHGMLKYFGFDEGYINLNNGSYGAVPLPVTKYCDEINRLSEARPDLFFRTTYKPLLREVRASVAKLIGAETDECVMVPNATHGINTVLRNFTWEEGDIFVNFSTTYGAIKQTLHYFRDTPPHVTIHNIPLVFPMTHAEILKTFRSHMDSLPDTYDQKVVVVIDTMASNPGVRLPWEQLVKICKEYKAWSVLDAAHSIGALQVNLSESRPDFWVSNCHKWLMAKRACAVLYVPRRNQHLMRTSFPTSWGYVSPPETATFESIFESTGTMDQAPYLSVKAALDFRESIGGEQAIQDFCNTLAAQGGELMAEILGTGTTHLTEDFIGPMTNVRLPLPAVEESLKVTAEKTADMMNELMHGYNTFVAVFMHGGSWWIRASAQIWNELSDFEYVAKALKAMCDKRSKTT